MIWSIADPRRKRQRMTVIMCLISIAIYAAGLTVLILYFENKLTISLKRPLLADHAGKFITSKRVNIAYNVLELNSDDRTQTGGNSDLNNEKEILELLQFKRTHFMTLGRWHGRIGNHMFQYATLLAMSLHYGYTAYATPPACFVDVFRLDGVKVLNDTSIRTVNFNEVSCCTYNEAIEHLNTSYNYRLHGYLQSWRYFENHEKDVRKLFQMNATLLNTASEFLSNVSQPGTDNVCVHVRVFGADSINGGHVVANMSYINKAMAYMRNTVKKVQFIVVSNKLTYNTCRSITGSDVVHSPFKLTRPMHDLALLTLCDHVIVTSGTFGWWGAWLAGGKVVYWRGFPSPGSGLYNNTNVADYYPPDWIGLD